MVIYRFALMWFILFNYRAENIYASFQLIASILNLVIPDANLSRFIIIILLLFPIEITFFLLLQLYFFFKRLFQSELNTEETKNPHDLYFISFVISGYAANFAIFFKVYYPWLYTSVFMDASGIAITSQIYYIKLMISIICNFVFLIMLLVQYKRVKKVQPINDIIN